MNELYKLWLCVEAFDEIYGLYGRLRWHLMHIAWEIEAIFDDLQNNNPGHAPGGRRYDILE
jgi:hypothetical protein